MVHLVRRPSVAHRCNHVHSSHDSHQLQLGSRNITVTHHARITADMHVQLDRLSQKLFIIRYTMVSAWRNRRRNNTSDTR